MSTTITSASWWKAAAIRALRTALVVAIPYVGGASLTGIPWAAVGSAAALAAVLSLVTSLAGIAEAAGAVQPIWLALLERTTKTAAQAIVSGVGTALLFQDVPWSTVLQAAAIAALGSLLIGVLGFLPESTLTGTPLEPATVEVGTPVTSNTPAIVPAPADPKQPAAGTPPIA
jgi:hypothetical protein